MAVAERDQMRALLTGVERLTNIISRCRIYEILYLDGIQYEGAENAIHPATEKLEAALIALYTAVLKFLAKARRAFNKSGIRRAQDGFFNPDIFEDMAKEFQVLDVEVVATVGNCKEVCDRKAHKELLKVLGEPVHRIDSGVESLLHSVSTQRRTQILQWISAIPYEDNHNTASTGHTSGTGEWLLQHSTYLDWKTSPTSNILWLHGIRKGAHFLLMCWVDRANNATTSSRCR
jgi:hypothetical protein